MDTIPLKPTVDTQLFRLSGTEGIQKVKCNQFQGRYVTFLEDIEDVFRVKVKHIKNGDVILTWLRDEDGNR